MSKNYIDVPLFKKMVMNGAINLKNNHQEIDELNVFPVPDGDTGINMQKTIMSGVREMSACQSTSIEEVAKSLSRGCLMGASGNSGVILSQFFRGIYVGIKDLHQEQVSINDFLKVLVSGYKVAYKAVMEPVEGTILTVVREAAENCVNKKVKYNTINELIEDYLSEAKKSLAHTPELLPVLKEAGVVDSGGAGFVKIVEGILLALNGTILEANDAQETSANINFQGGQETDIEFGYCTEFILELKHPESFVDSDIKAPLSLLGNSLVCVTDENILKIHVHTNKPGRVLEIGQKLGEFIKIKIENMRLQHSELTQAKKEETKKRKENAIIAVCFGDGITDTFKSLGVDYVIEGGQTMNPSTESFVNAIKEVNADNIIIIPNNSNVIMSAEQAASLVEGSNVRVLKAKTIAQGYASLMVYDLNANVDENLEAMQEAVQNCHSGEVTYSIRDTEINGVTIKSGDFMGIADGKIVVSTTTCEDATKALLSNIVSEDSNIVTIFVGKDAQDDVAQFEDLIHEINEDIEIEVILGKQDIYSYIIAVE